MTFENPYAFWFLLLVLIPIIMHFFNFRRYKKIPYSNTLFFRNVKKSNVKKSNIRKRILLASRILTIFTIVLLLSEPELDNSTIVANNFDFIVIDNGQYTSSFIDQSGQTIIDASINIATSLAQENQIDIKSFDGFGLIDLQSIDNQLLVKNHTGLGIQSLNEQSNFLLISPITRHVFEALQRNKFDTTNSVIQVKSEMRANVFIDSVFVEQNNEGNLLINVVVINESSFFSGTINVKLTNQNTQLGLQTVDFNGTNKANVSFEINNEFDSERLLKLEVSDYSTPFNNEFYVTIPNIDKVSIYHIAEISHNAFINRLLANDSLFVYESGFSNRTNQNTFDNYDFLILEGKVSDKIELSDISRYIKNGGNLLMIPDRKGDFDKSLFELYFGTLQNYKGKESLLEIDFQHPFFDNILSNLDDNIDMPKVHALLNRQKTNNSYVYTNKGLSIVEKHNNDNMYLLNMDFTKSEFQRHALFLPILYKIFISPESELGASYFFTNDDFLQLTIEELEPTSIFVMENEGISVIPDQRILNSNEVVINLPHDVIRPGFYKLVDQQSGEVVKQFAVNLPTSQKLIQQTDWDELIAWESENKGIKVYNSSELPPGINVSIDENKLELKDYLVIFVLIFLVLEVLAFRFL